MVLQLNTCIQCIIHYYWVGFTFLEQQGLVVSQCTSLKKRHIFLENKYAITFESCAFSENAQAHQIINQTERGRDIYPKPGGKILAIHNGLAIKPMQSSLRQLGFLAQGYYLPLAFGAQRDNRLESLNRIFRSLPDAFQKKLEPLPQVIVGARPRQIVVRALL